MKKSIFLLLSFCLTLNFTYGFSSVLAPEEVQDVRTNVSRNIGDYYQGLNLLTNGPEDAKQRLEATNTVIDQFYESKETYVYNDYANGQNIDKMHIDEYLENLAVHFSDEKKGFTFSEPKMTVSDVFVDENEKFFFVKVEVERTFYSATDASVNNTQTIDYYIKFKPNSKTYKIYTMAKHTDNISSFKKATIQNKDVLSDLPPSVNSPNPVSVAAPSYFVFNITPTDAEVKIDGKVTYVVNGMKIPVQAGKHKIELSAKGYKQYATEDFIVKEGQNNYSAMLQTKMGALSIINAHNAEIGASIYIDGKLVGTVPMKRIPLDEGKHAVRIIKQGFFIKSYKKTVQEEKDEEITARLVNIENTKKGIETTFKILMGK